MHPFVGKGHGKVVHPLVLEHLRHLEVTRAVRRGLDHRHELRTVGELGAEIVEVMDHRIEIDLQHGGVALAGQRMGDLLETEVAGALQQHGAAGHGPAADAGNALVGRGIELPVARKERGIAFQAGPDADEGVDAGTRDHARHAAVEFVVRQTALRDVRQDEGTPPRERHVVQVVEGQGQRIEVEVVGVVDEHRVVDTLLDFEAHGYLGGRGERRGRELHGRTEGLDDLGVAPRGLVADDRLRDAGICGRIVELPLGEMRGDQAPERLVVAVVDDLRRAARQCHLLEALLFEVQEVFLMGVADRGEDHHVGADDTLEALHLTGFRDAGLEDGQLFVALEHQHRKGHTQLRVVALGRAVALHPRGELLGQPLLDDGLAVRARDAHDRTAETGPVVGSQRLQRVDGILHHDVAAPLGRLDGALDQKGAHAPPAHLPDVVVRIVVGAPHGHEHRTRGQLARQRTAVGHHRLHLAVAAGKDAARDGGDL